MGKKDRPPPRHTLIIGILLSWIGLAGLADNIVEWQQWFEIGIIQHWRFTKAWATETCFYWLPFPIPSWLIDYSVLGSIYIRAYSYNISQKAADEYRTELSQSETSHFSIYDHSNHTAVWFIGNFAVWPVSLLLVLVDAFLDVTARPHRHSPQTFATIKKFILSVFAIIPILFLATDFIKTFHL